MIPSTAEFGVPVSTTSQWTRRARAVFLVFLYGLAAWFALSEFIRWPGMERSRTAVLDDMIYGQAYRPYVTRALVPLALRALVAATPPAIREAGGRLVLDETEGDENLSWVRRCPYEFGLTVVLLFLTLVALAFSLRRLGAVTLGLTGMPRDFAPAISLLVLPTQYWHMNHLYDFATLLLFALGILSLAERRWRLYATVFVLATINKETSSCSPWHGPCWRVVLSPNGDTSLRLPPR